ncbi:hypothetical protein HNQ03_000572 [Chryseobacterium sp. 16F]|uniref:Uncharacterized protein n=1 Tax=Frigoriflavimonas asaccharolytica TaxID=2735899 RepID=A0A8J8G6A2_9FLAO|nr:hypothetical protein [Frigoriflavimonas asaccharolytica]
MFFWRTLNLLKLIFASICIKKYIQDYVYLKRFYKQIIIKVITNIKFSNEILKL